MAEHIEVARAFVTIVPSMEGSQATITKELTGVTTEASEKAGKEGGSKFGEKFAGAVKGASVAIGAALTAATGAVVATGKAFVNTANDVSSAGDAIGDNAAKMGLSTKAYQEWDFVLQRAGSSIDAMKTSMKTLQNAAASGNDAFKALGITQQELKNLSPEELFDRTVKALQGVEDTTTRTALASKVLGKGAIELGGVFDMTSEELDQTKQKMYDLGAYMDEDMLAASDNYQDTMLDMQDSIKGLKMRVVSDFLPGMTSVMNGLSKVFSGKGGVGEIQTGLKSIVDSIASLAPQFLPIAETLILSLIKGFGPMLPTLTTSIFSVIIQAITTVTTMIPQMMPSIIAGLQGIMMALLKAMPVILNGLTELIMSIVTWLSSDGVIQDFVNGIVQLTSQLVNSFAMILPVLLPAIVKIIMEVCKALTEPSNVKLLLDAVLTLVGAIFMALVNCVPELIEGVKGVLLNLGNLVGDFLYWIVPKVAGGLTNVINTVKKWGENIKGFFTGLWTNLKDGVTKGLDNIKQKFTSIFDNLKNIVKNAIEKIKSFFNFKWSLPKLKMPHFSISGSFSLNPPSIPKFSVSWYAKAMDEPMILNGATIFGASNGNLLGGGEVGSEVIVGTDKLMDMMREAVGANNQPITINVYGAEGQNVNDLAEKIAEKLEDMTKRKGAVYA